MTNPQALPLLPGPPATNAESLQHEAISPAKGYLLTANSALFNVVMSMLIHIAETTYGYPTFSAVIIRTVTSVMLPLAYLWWHGLLHTLRLPRVQLLRLGLRGICGATATVCAFHALKVLPVGTAITLFYASPAITSVLAAIFLNDPFTLAHGATLVANFIGIALVAHATEIGDGRKWALKLSSGETMRGIAFAIGTAFASSVAYTAQRLMGMRVHFVLGVLSSGVGCLVYSLAFASPAALFAISHSGTATVLATLSGCASFGSMSLLNRGLQHAPAGPAIVVRSMNVPVGYVVGLLLMKEIPSPASFVGATLVLASVASIGWRM